MVNFRKFLLPNKPVIFLKIFREIYVCPKELYCWGDNYYGQAAPAVYTQAAPIRLP